MPGNCSLRREGWPVDGIASLPILHRGLRRQRVPRGEDSGQSIWKRKGNDCVKYFDYTYNPRNVAKYLLRSPPPPSEDSPSSEAEEERRPPERQKKHMESVKLLEKNKKKDKTHFLASSFPSSSVFPASRWGRRSCWGGSDGRTWQRNRFLKNIYVYFGKENVTITCLRSQTSSSSWAWAVACPAGAAEMGKKYFFLSKKNKLVIFSVNSPVSFQPSSCLSPSWYWCFAPWSSGGK